VSTPAARPTQSCLPVRLRFWERRNSRSLGCRQNAIFFMWTVLHGRCWTSERRHHHGICSFVDCAFCGQEAEHIDHLFVRCAFSREVWLSVLHRCGWEGLCPRANHRLIEWWTSTMKRVSKPKRCAFYSLVIGVTWCLWL
jgi:hypothetical protein